MVAEGYVHFGDTRQAPQLLGEESSTDSHEVVVCQQRITHPVMRFSVDAAQNVVLCTFLNIVVQCG